MLPKLKNLLHFPKSFWTVMIPKRKLKHFRTIKSSTGWSWLLWGVL